MSVIWWVLLGFALGVALTVAVAYRLLTSDKVLVVDRWWMNSPASWEWLREYELGERSGREQ